jgi:GTP-binding protein
MQIEDIRNIAIIAHVDHGKTTLVDKMLYQSGMFKASELDSLAGGRLGLIMDSDPLERERGITILSKNCAIYYTPIPEKDEKPRKYKINIIDTPGHADFGGEVERVLKMADGALLLVDAFDGVMPQTRFVLQHALKHNLKIIGVINKVDRKDSRPHEVAGQVFDLLADLGADEKTLDFPVIYASAREGWASDDPDKKTQNLETLFNAIIKHVPPPHVDSASVPQMLVTTLDYSEFIGRIAIGKVVSGKIAAGQDVGVITRSGELLRQKILQLFSFEGLGKKETDVVEAGDLCAVSGLDPIEIGDTITDPENPKRLETITVGEPTLHMTFRVNDGPFSGREGRFVTSRQVKERLERELQSNVALRVEPGESADEFKVSGRGVMHLGILLENMRREGYELCAGKPKVIYKKIDGKTCEPIELLVITCPPEMQRPVMALLGERRAEMLKMESRAGASSYLYMEFKIPSRGLIGLTGRVASATQGKAVMHHVFMEYGPSRGEIPQRQTGVMISSHSGPATMYALDALYDRGQFFIKPGDPIYEGQVVGEHCKEMDISVNVTREKHLTNVRAAGKDDAARIRPPREMTLEGALEYIQEDELVEITPKSLRLRKRLLGELARRRAFRAGKQVKKESEDSE